MTGTPLPGCDGATADLAAAFAAALKDGQVLCRAANAAAPPDFTGGGLGAGAGAGVLPIRVSSSGSTFHQARGRVRIRISPRNNEEVTVGGSSFHQLNNITSFLRAAKSLGVPASEVGAARPTLSHIGFGVHRVC